MSNWEPEPDTDEVLQYEPDDVGTPVVVVVRGPVHSQSLPSKAAGARGRQVTDTTGVRLLTADPHRSRALICSLAKPFLFGGGKAEVEIGQAGVWPAGVPLEVKAVDELWVMCQATGQTDTITVYQERWAEG